MSVTSLRQANDDVFIYNTSGRWCGVPVDGVLALDDLPLGVGLARLDEVGAAARVQLQAVRPLPVVRATHLQINTQKS